MLSDVKGKSKESKADPGKRTTTTPSTIQVEEMSQEIPRERSFRQKVKKKLQNLFSKRSSNSRATSRVPSERRKSQEYLPVSDTTANSEIGDQNRSVEMMKDDLGEPLNAADRGMGFIGSTSEEAMVDAKAQSVDFPMAPQDSIHESKREVQVMHTTGEGVFRDRTLDKGKSRDDRAEGLGGAGGRGFLAAIPRPPRQDDDILEIPEADNREISRNQFPDIGGLASQFQGAHHITISGDSHFENIGVKNEYKNEYNYANYGGTYDIPILKDSVSFNAMHDSSVQDPTRRVHPGTRQHVLKHIRYWIDMSSAKERIFWLHGPAGVGKSAIAQTIAHSCARESLAATFFFYRSDSSRNDGNRLFTTLAWQFAYSIPATKKALIRSVSERPDICTKAVETQFEELIVKPFLELKRSGVQLSAPVVIIDGVDECSDDSLQRRFLKIIGNAVKDDRVPLRFLICSRPEAHIQDTINIFQSITLSLDLAKLDDTNQDIEKYLRAEFFRIATEQGLDAAWPGEEIIQELVYKASGQFIYASTVIKYVGDEYSSAETQLDIIRGLKPASNISPFAELDELYKEILRRQRDPVFLKDFLSLFLGRNWIGLPVLYEDDDMLMSVSENELHRKLRGMRSVLKFEPYIDVHHRSFLDFLLDSSRSGQYHISKQAGTRRYLDFIVDALVRFASTIIKGHDDHQTHFNPQFRNIFHFNPLHIYLPVEEWCKALQPLLNLQNNLLNLPNFRCVWDFVPCKDCAGLLTMRDLLLHLTFRASDLIAESHTDEFEQIHNNVTSLNPTETGINTPEKNLDAFLSSLLPRLRRRKLGISLSTDMIQLMVSLLHFNHAEIAMKLQSTLDAQSLVDVIDELINSNRLCNDSRQDMSYKALHLALEIYTRVPVLPLSLFSKGIVGPQHDVRPIGPHNVYGTELLFHTAFICKILDPRYIVRVLWVYEANYELVSVSDKVNENSESLSIWRRRSNPRAVTRVRIMHEVAKAIQYFHSIGIVIGRDINSDDIFLDAEFHARFRFRGSNARYVNMTPHGPLDQSFRSQEENIFLFGCLFYEMCFNAKIMDIDGIAINSNAVAKRPLKPKIRDDEWELIQRCCAEEPKNRPTIDKVVQEMDTILA